MRLNFPDDMHSKIGQKTGSGRRTKLKLPQNGDGIARGTLA